MSGARILYPQFRDEQGNSKYPFADNATLVSKESQLSVGRALFIDASFYVIDAIDGFYLSQIVVTSDRVTLFVGDTAKKLRASAAYPTNNPPANGMLEFVDDYNRPAGMLLSRRLSLFELSAWPAGTHTFAQTATPFVASVVIPTQEPGVRGILTENGDLLTGDLWLIGDQGVQLRQDGAGVIRIDIIGEPLFLRALCADKNKFTPKNFIKTINGCPPDEYGNFILNASGVAASDTILRIYPRDKILVIDAIGKKVV